MGLYKIIEENFRIDDTDKIRLMGAIQKLEQYESNPLAQLEPCWKYVKQNSIEQQLEHIREETIEARFAHGLDDMAMECFDVLQASITLMYILQTKFHVDIAKLIELGKAKNNSRGYYKKDQGGSL